MTTHTSAAADHPSVLPVGPLVGTRPLIRLILRRDRIALPIWIGLVALLGVGVGASFVQLYGTAEEVRTVIAETIASPATIAMLGPVYAPNVGALVAWRWTMQGAIVLGLFSLLTVIRHTRVEEEAGRSELLGSAVVGRFAALTAALAVTLGADLVLAAIVAAGLIAVGLPAAGSAALGLSVACVCWVIAAIAGIAAQVSERSGAARGIAGAAFAVLYLMRSFGDIGGADGRLAWLSWLSPFGWARRTRPFAGERWWIFGLFAGAVVLTTAVAYALAARRDLGAGLVAPRPGPAVGAPGLHSPLALAWRLQRGTLLGWTAGFAVVGILFGLLATTVASMLSANPAMAAFLARLGTGSQPGETAFTLFFVAFGPAIAIYAISAVLRLRSEETQGLADAVLGRPVSRLRWMGSHLLVAALGQVVVLAALGLTCGLTYGYGLSSTGREVLRVVAATLAYVPAVWVMGGIAAALFGVAPRLAAGGWVALGVVALLELGRELQQIGPAFYGISPFAHVPKLLAGEAAGWPLLALIVVAVALSLVGLIGFRRRDVNV